MNPGNKETEEIGLLDRFRKSWFPPVAVVGAFTAFVAAIFRVRPAPKTNPQTTEPAGRPRPPEQSFSIAAPRVELEREYSRSAVLGGSASTHPFRRSLAGVAIGAGDKIYALSDDQVRIFEPNGDFVQGWRVPQNASCLTLGPDGCVYVGTRGHVEIYDAAGGRIGGFAAGEKDEAADITALKIFRKEVLVADAAARLIRRYDSSGRQLGVIGINNKTGSFILPNKWLDFDVNSEGTIRATDTGRHLVTAWALDGSPLGSFGKFGMSNPEDFVGCCNPVNLALTPDGKIVTGEKMVARVKVYEPDGKLLAVIGPENFDPNCIHIHLAVDSRGRILAADPVRRQVSIFSLVAKTGLDKRSSTRGIHPSIDGKRGELERV
jgi:hypothetical protein